MPFFKNTIIDHDYISLDEVHRRLDLRKTKPQNAP